MSTATLSEPKEQALPQWEPHPETEPQNINPKSPPVVQPLAPVKPGDTVTGATTIDQLIATLYQTNTFGTPVKYVWLDPTYLGITYSHQSVIYIRFATKAQPGQTTYKIGLS